MKRSLNFRQRLSAAKAPPEVLAHGHPSLERQISATDAQIDRLVYDLYGLTEDETKMVEGTT